MATKQNGVACYDKAAPDEPIFVLRAHDQLAPAVVLYWCRLAVEHGVSGPTVQEAMNCAEDMRLWGLERGSKIPG